MNNNFENDYLKDLTLLSWHAPSIIEHDDASSQNNSVKSCMNNNYD